jgi:hypothetical protein
MQRKARFYRCDRTRRFQFSEQRLRQLFRAWRKRGPKALILHYRAPIKIGRRDAERFAVACVSVGAKRLKDGFRMTSKRVAGLHGYRRALPVKVLNAITRLHRWRRFRALQEKKTARAIRRWTK